MQIQCRVCETELTTPMPARCPTCGRTIQRPFVDPGLFRSLVGTLIDAGSARRAGDAVVLVPSGASVRLDYDDPDDTLPDRRLSFARAGLPTVRLQKAPRGRGHAGFAGRVELDTDVSEETLASLFASGEIRERIVALLRGWDDVLRLHDGGLSLDSPLHEPWVLDPNALVADAANLAAIGSALPTVAIKTSSASSLAVVVSVVSVFAFVPAIVLFEHHFASVQPVSWTAYGLMLPGPFLVAALLYVTSRFASGGTLRFGISGCVTLPFLFVAGAFLGFDAVVWANARLDGSTPIRADVPIRSAEIQHDDDDEDEVSFYAELTDPTDANGLIQLRITDPPFPDTSRAVLNVAICPGALGIRWFCAMPPR